jgi:hypothetical protein
MLLQKQKIPYIAIFKTSAGEEFIAKVTEETSDYFMVEHPLCIVGVEQGLRFAPYLMMADPKKPMLIPKPIITAQPVIQMEQQYESSITGIALPQKGSIIV